MYKKIAEIQFADGIVGKDRADALHFLEKAGFSIVIDRDYFDESKYYVIKEYNE